MQVGQNVVYPHDAVWRNQQGNTPSLPSLLRFGRKKVFAKKEEKKKNWQKSLIKAIKGNENQTALSRAKMDDEQSQDGWCAATSCNIWVPTGLPNTEIAHCTLNNCTTLCAAAANVTRG